jgi:hypothetical protein
MRTGARVTDDRRHPGPVAATRLRSGRSSREALSGQVLGDRRHDQSLGTVQADVTAAGAIGLHRLFGPKWTRSSWTTSPSAARLQPPLARRQQADEEAQRSIPAEHRTARSHRLPAAVGDRHHVLAKEGDQGAHVTRPDAAASGRPTEGRPGAPPRTPPGESCSRHDRRAARPRAARGGGPTPRSRDAPGTHATLARPPARANSLGWRARRGRGRTVQDAARCLVILNPPAVPLAPGIITRRGPLRIS